MAANSRQNEIRLWWPLPLAVLIWLLMIWIVGFYISLSKVEPEMPPPPISASFIDLNESEEATTSMPVTPPSAPTPPQPEKPKLAETKPAPKLPPPTAKAPAAQPQTKPKVAQQPVKPKTPIPEQEVAKTKAREEAEEAPADLSEFINRAKARRRAEGLFDDSEAMPSNAAKQPSADEVRMANVRRNLQNPGTSGIFQIIRIGPRTAEFSFRAWITGQSNPRLQMIQVTAGPDGDVERAIIRRMIELIREHYKEDFNWESHRLHRVVVLSAREKDTAGLEEFLMREFFINYTR